MVQPAVLQVIGGLRSDASDTVELVRLSYACGGRLCLDDWIIRAIAWIIVTYQAGLS
jgi:hypothetical protein